MKTNDIELNIVENIIFVLINRLVDAEIKIQGLRKELFKSEENLRHFQRRQKDNPLDKIE